MVDSRRTERLAFAIEGAGDRVRYLGRLVDLDAGHVGPEPEAVFDVASVPRRVHADDRPARRGELVKRGRVVGDKNGGASPDLSEISDRFDADLAPSLLQPWPDARVAVPDDLVRRT